MLMNYMSGIRQTLEIALLFFGAAQCFFGYRIFQATSVLASTIVGAGLGGLIGLLASGWSSVPLTAILLGSAFGWLTWNHSRVGLFFQCFQTGILVAILPLLATMKSPSELNLQKCAFVLLAGLTLGILGAWRSRLAGFCSGALSGGAWIGLALYGLKGSPGYLALGMVAAALGTLFQYFLSRIPGEDRGDMDCSNYQEEEGGSQTAGVRSYGMVSLLGMGAFALCLGVECGVSVAILASLMLLLFSGATLLALRLARA